MRAEGVIVYSGLNYADIIYMKWYKLKTVTKRPTYNYFSSLGGRES